MFKFIRNWAVVSVLLLVLTLLWHAVIFSGAYATHLSLIARYVGGTPTPLFAYFLLAHVLVALGFVKFIPSAAREDGMYVGYGMTMGWVTFGVFAVLSHALFAGWGGWLMAMDVAFGTVAGAITGWVVKRLS